MSTGNAHTNVEQEKYFDSQNGSYRLTLQTNLFQTFHGSLTCPSIHNANRFTSRMELNDKDVKAPIQLNQRDILSCHPVILSTDPYVASLIIREERKIG